MQGSSRRNQRSARRARGAVLAAVVATATLGAPAARAAVPPGAPELVAPPSGHVFGLAETQFFTIRVADGDGDDWVGHLEVTELRTGLVTLYTTAVGDAGGTSTAVAPPGLRPATYSWRARAVDTTGNVGEWSGSRTFTVGTNRAPNPPQLLSPADGATLRRMGNLPFSITTIDHDNDVFTGSITIRNANGSTVDTLSTSPAPSGGTAYAVLVRPLLEGTYTWTAEAEDVHGAPSGPSSARTFTVSSPATAGGGALVGEVAFGSPGIPPTIGVCEPSAPTFTLDAAAAVVNAVVVGYVGPLELRGAGASTCETALLGTGAVTMDVTGTGPTESSLTCLGLTGSYTRVEAALVLQLSGGCRINNRPVSRVTWRASLAFVPRQSTAGVTTRVRDATVAGAFVVVPE